VIRNLSGHYELSLLSGDNSKQQSAFESLFGEHTRFNLR